MKYFIILTLVICVPFSYADEVTNQDNSQKTITISECLDNAYKYNDQLKLAQEELDVLDIKKTEASRNLYPNIMAKAERTKGLAEPLHGIPGFREQSYGMQLNWAFFEGGRLKYINKQANLNVIMGRIKYRKTKIEVFYNILEAYTNVSRYLHHLKNFENAFREVDRLYSMSVKMYEKGNLSKKEFVSMQSQYNQAIYQIKTTKIDIDTNMWLLNDSMGFSTPLKTYPSSEINFVRKSIFLDECLNICEQNNPDIEIQKIMLRVNEYGEKVKSSYKWPKVTLDGFYGRSGGAYDSEDLKLREDYSLGVQLSQPFAMNTISANNVQQRTSPKVGQSTRSQSHTESASVSFLDTYKQKVEEKDAEFAQKQAVYNLAKAKTSCFSEVRKAFANYQKGLLQIENAKVDLDIAKKELDIAKLSLGDKSNIADLAGSVNKYAAALNAYVDAKAFYKLALAALDKAIGFERKFFDED
jgi:outer membrane protein TolC